MTNPWLLNGIPVDEDELNEYVSFVYLITNTVNGRKYIGKKTLKFVRREKVKNQKRRKTVTKESDWASYYGSSEELAKDIASLGKDVFKREILRLCKSKSEASYYELKEQMVNDVLLRPGEYYNSYAGARINRKHVLGKFKP